MRPVRIFATAAAVAGIFSIHARSVYADDANPLITPLKETVVSASKIETPREDVGRDIDVRWREDFNEQQTSSLIDNLQTIPGIRAQSLGGPGAPGAAPIEIRGFRTSGTQLLFNGLRLNDPSSISGIADSYFSYLTSNDLDSVEVLKGANGTLYGSDGQAGSLNLLSAMPTKGTFSEITLRGGSFRTHEEIGKLNVGTDDFGLRTTVTRLDSESLQEDGNYENTTVSSIGKAKLNEEITLTPMFRVVSAMNDLDSSPTLGQSGELITNQPSESNQVGAQSYFYGLSTDFRPCDEFGSKLSLYANITDRSYFYDFSGFKSVSDFKGKSYNLDWQNSVSVEDLNSVFLAGAEVEHQDYDTVAGGVTDTGSQDRYALYAKDRLSFFDKTLLIDLGGRVTHVSAIDRVLPSFEASGVFKIDSTMSRLHSSLTQGFRSPSLFELQGKMTDETDGSLITVGNRTLKPEESLSFDFGVTQQLIEKLVETDLTFFNLASDETVVFDFPGRTHFNGGGGENQGLEYSLTATPTEQWKIRAAYTYLSKADVGGERLQRRPYNVAAIASSLKLGVATLYNELRYRGNADVEFFGFDDVFREGDYTVLDTALTVLVSSNAEIFVRGNNLFDVNYTEAGYRMPGISFFGGVRFKLH